MHYDLAVSNQKKYSVRHDSKKEKMAWNIILSWHYPSMQARKGRAHEGRRPLSKHAGQEREGTRPLSEHADQEREGASEGPPSWTIPSHMGGTFIFKNVFCFLVPILINMAGRDLWAHLLNASQGWDKRGPPSWTTPGHMRSTWGGGVLWGRGILIWVITSQRAGVTVTSLGGPAP